jgi:two-component system response regulator HydG
MTSEKESETILVVDDSATTREMIQRKLAAVGFRVYTAEDVGQALAVLASAAIDLVITDLKMPGATGMELIRHVRENLKDTEIIMVTGYPTVAGAVEAVKRGAEEYLPKPFTDAELLAAVRQALVKLTARRVASRPLSPLNLARSGLIGESAALRRVVQAIEKAAVSSATVLITGESGTGKELVARAIHYRSDRSAAPFVPVNCGAIPQELFESELFGYVRGAFTDARENRIGFFQTANHGTIFLDEVSETSPTMQVKLLRVLQDKQIAMVGSRQMQTVDVHIVAATNKDLAALVGKGSFREDLYYRLNVLAIEIPPLREREDDVLILANHFAAKYAAESGRPAPRFDDETLQALRRYDWPGNVRELENVVQRLSVMMDGDAIRLPDLPPAMRYSVSAGQNHHRTLAEVELQHIRNVLASVDGNKTRAAEILGIDRKTLREKLKES